jgi:hypothetical protein
VSCAWTWRSGRKARLPLVHFSTISPRLLQLHVLVLPSAIAVAGDRDAGRDRLRERHLQEFHGVLFADAVDRQPWCSPSPDQWDALTDGASDPPKHFAHTRIPLPLDQPTSLSQRHRRTVIAVRSGTLVGKSMEHPRSRIRCSAMNHKRFR